KSAVKSVGDLVRRVIIWVHCDRKKGELLVRLVFDRQPNRLNVVFSEIFSKALLTFARTKGAGAYLESWHGLLRGARDETRIPARVRIETERVQRCGTDRQQAEQDRCSNDFKRRERLMLSLWNRVKVFASIATACARGWQWFSTLGWSWIWYGPGHLGTRGLGNARGQWHTRKDWHSRIEASSVSWIFHHC